MVLDVINFWELRYVVHSKRLRTVGMRMNDFNSRITPGLTGLTLLIYGVLSITRTMYIRLLIDEYKEKSTILRDRLYGDR